MSVADTIQNIMMKIPGYRGYAEKEQRRAADKELRDATAAAFASQVTRIARVQDQMMGRGDLDNIESLDSIITRLQHLADRIRTASYGFSGFFDENKVDEAVLDRLYAFDLKLANGVEATGDLIARLGLGDEVTEMIDALRNKLDELHDAFSERGQILSGFGDAPAGEESPVSPPPSDPLAD